MSKRQGERGIAVHLSWDLAALVASHQSAYPTIRSEADVNATAS
jgi:hypothetical protein